MLNIIGYPLLVRANNLNSKIFIWDSSLTAKTENYYKLTYSVKINCVTDSKPISKICTSPFINLIFHLCIFQLYVVPTNYLLPWMYDILLYDILTYSSLLYTDYLPLHSCFYIIGLYIIEIVLYIIVPQFLSAAFFLIP